MNDGQQPGESRVDIPNLSDDEISISDEDVNMRNDKINDKQQSGESRVDNPNLLNALPQSSSRVTPPFRHRTMDDEQVRMIPGPITWTELHSLDLDMVLREKLYRRRQENSKNKYHIESSYSYRCLPVHVRYHEKLKVVHDAYISIKRDGHMNIPERTLHEPISFHESKIFQLRSPMGNTLLHVAAMYGNDNEVERITQCYKNLLTAKNVNGDTALHLAAKLGRKGILTTLLAALLSDFNFPLRANDQTKAIERIFTENKKGNTFLHEAILNRRDDVVNFAVSHEKHSSFQHHSYFKNLVAEIALTYRNKENKHILYLAIEAGYRELIEQALDQAYQDWIPPGKSFFLAAILKQDQDILETILRRKPKWIHSADWEERTLLHYAASTGYIAGVRYLLEQDSSCASATDKFGFLPVHLASDGGHVEIVHKLLEYCPYPREMLDYEGRNILHLAIQSGKFNVVEYILQSNNHDLQEMINQKDFNGNTPLHLATFHCHPKIVHALTWEKNVELNSTNNDGQTALDLCQDIKNPSFRQRLTWAALESAGVKQAHELGPCCIKAPPKNTESHWNQEPPNMDHFKDRIGTLILVSTLIVTVTFAAGFTLPGGTDSSDKGKGRAFMLYHTLFQVYILCLTVSMYGALSVTIILIWAQLGDLTLAILALKVVKPILGITLATLSVAFMAGLHLVISDLKWLAATTLALCVIFVLTLLFLYTLLWFPSHSGNIVFRYISYYPFLFLARLVDRDETSGICRPPDSQEKGTQCSQSERVGNSAK